MCIGENYQKGRILDKNIYHVPQNSLNSSDELSEVVNLRTKTSFHPEDVFKHDFVDILFEVGNNSCKPKREGEVRHMFLVCTTSAQ